ncbi:MAG: cadmium-translocating P-type ATPase [Chloroflexi bacterium]|nr:cadmium-translocating P-type ATPase [Chloroflexota bacterium]MCI0731381.1 cadmium-translocating P-type ATPase [Chloroflexota bacterium]
MTTETQTLILPVQPTISEAIPTTDWKRRWRFQAEALAQTLGPRQGVLKIQLDRAAGTLTVEYDPDRFSLDQLKALGQEVGLVIGRAVHHTIVDLPAASRTAPARELEARLKAMPGVARAAANPLARTLAIEYLDDSPTTGADVLQQLRAWGYRAQEWQLAVSWWEKNQLIVYTVVAGLALLAGWLAERAGAGPWLWGTLFALAYLAGGGFAARNGFNALRQGQIDVDFLMVAAALGAAVIGEWVEGGVLLFLFALSNALEHYAMDRTRQAIRALMELRPATARVRREGREVTLPVEELVIGDVLDVRPGERLPADGEVISGQSAVDQSPITGESIPAPRGPGDPVFAGSINGNGALEVRVTKRAEDSTLARIILLVEEAQSERAPTQRRLDDLEQKYAMGVIGLAVLVILLPPLLLGWTWSDAFYKAMTLLVVASPCALVISTPASILSAIAAGARHGVLFKGGAHVESLARVRVVAFDKTGTLTVGQPRVTHIEPTDCCSETELLVLAAAVEARSEHPLAQAVVTAARARHLSLAEATDLQAVVGKGVTAQVDGRTVHIGAVSHLREQEITIPPEMSRRVESLEAQGKTVMLVGDDTRRALGLIAVADTVRPEARQAVAALKAAGVEKVVMLTGDNARAAQAIGLAAGVDEVRAELLPEEKVAEVKRLLQEYGSVAMVGDGVNDAPALASASVGIAMGAGGTDVALETADVVLMASDLSKLPYALRLSQRAMSIVRQNLTFALGVIVVLIASAFLNIVSLSLGVVGHEGSTVIVVLNGLRLLGYRPPAPTSSGGQWRPVPAGGD